MNVNRTSRAKILWVAGVLLVISLAVAILAWQARVAYLRKALVDSLLTDTPCAAPCWQGIVPGETSGSQAMQILEDSPYILRDSLQKAGTSETGGATWWWRVPGRRLQPSISWQDDTVQEITLGLTYDLVIEQVVSRFGPPEALNVGPGGVPEHRYWIIDLYYPHTGVQFKAYTPEFENSLEPSTEVGVAEFFAPTTLEKRVEEIYGGEGAEYIVSHVMNLMRTWRGYGNLFEVYYESPQDLELEK